MLVSPRWADEHRQLFIASIGPGYDDSKIRPWVSAVWTAPHELCLVRTRLVVCAGLPHASCSAIPRRGLQQGPVSAAAANCDKALVGGRQLVLTADCTVCNCRMLAPQDHAKTGRGKRHTPCIGA